MLRALAATAVTATLTMTLALTLATDPAATPAAAGTTAARAACAKGLDSSAECGISYDTGNDPARTLDLRVPAGVTDAPLVIVIHGGGWRGGDSSAMAETAIYFADHGLATGAINYTLGGPGPANPSWPKVFADVRAAVAWGRARGDDYGFDGTRVGAFGSSAGGHLTGLLVTDDKSDITAAVSLSGPMDLLIQRRRTWPSRALLGCLPPECPRKAESASPALRDVDARDAEFLLFNGDLEIAVSKRHAVQMGEALADVGVANEVEIVPGHEHALEYSCDTVNVEGVTRTVVDASFAYLAARLAPRAGLTASGFCD